MRNVRAAILFQSLLPYSTTTFPSWAIAILLGFQHYLVMLGTTVFIPALLVPLMGGGNVEKAELINASLFVSGISTLLQTSWFGNQLPVVMGGSRSFLIPLCSIALSHRFDQYSNPHERFIHCMRAMQASLMMSSVVQMILGFSCFWRVFIRYLSPLAAAPFVTILGLGVFSVGFKQARMLNKQLTTCVEFGIPALIVVVFLSQGIGLLVAGVFGAVSGSSASIENAGLLGLTRIGSIKVIQISAGFMLFFSFLGKFGAVLASIPLPIFAGIYFVLHAYTAAVGLHFLDLCNFNCFRSMFIAGFSVFLGLSVSRMFAGQEASDSAALVILSSPASVAMMVAYFLDYTVPDRYNARRQDEDGGSHWCEAVVSVGEEVETRSYGPLH